MNETDETMNPEASETQKKVDESASEEKSG